MTTDRAITQPNPEHERLITTATDTDTEAAADRRGWRDWGPYLAERAWGTVREDYSPTGAAWESFPHEHARSRAYRWNEDGMAGICDLAQTWCFGLALWNGADPILKERMFGLTGNEGNHGEDVKDYWWYLDSTPTHSWMRWRYHYPQQEFPYGRLIDENRRRGKLEREFELVDTGVFDEGRFWSVTVDYAKAAPHDLCMLIAVRNHGPDEATIDVLPTLWFRNTWAWGLSGEEAVPVIRAEGGGLVAEHPSLLPIRLVGDGSPELLFCDNESNAEKLWQVAGRSPYPKDGINAFVVHGEQTVNPEQRGTKSSLHYRLTVPAGQTAEIRLRLYDDSAEPDPGGGFDAVIQARSTEADTFFADITPEAATVEEAMILRQAVAGLMWGKQYYKLDVRRWLDGDPAGPEPPPGRGFLRNGDWRHLHVADVISMPDPWEYPWFAAWDLAFHAVTLARVDPQFAKDQLLLLGREWYMHPNGQLPAYEWNFSDVNPPVHAAAALAVFRIDGQHDYDFLERIFHKLLLNFTWWVNRKDEDGNNVFGGGFLGLDNIGPIDRSLLPSGMSLEQSDGTAWMAFYCLSLLEIALELAEHDPVYEDLAVKFFEHFALIARAMSRQGLWDEKDGFYYDVLRISGGGVIPLRVRSMVGLLPLCATTTLGAGTLARLPKFAARVHWFLDNQPDFAPVVGQTHVRDGSEGRLLSIVGIDGLRRLLTWMLDEREFLSPYGLRALSARHANDPFSIGLGGQEHVVDYEPAESTSGLFGGNSNWRGPLWMPVNYLLVEALRRYARFAGDDLTVEFPVGSGRSATLTEVAADLSRRLISIFCEDTNGRRPVFGDYELFQRDPAWHDLLPFHEYFHGDSGAGLGASHQTGWTALVVTLIVRLRGPGRPGELPEDG
jgi:hypothetical protein